MGKAKFKSSPKADVLESYELLGIIFRGFGSSSQSERSELLAMGTVCRAFKRPALDRLWAVLPSFVPLLKLLPQLDEHEGQMYFNGDISLPAFTEYADRVRKITLPVISSGPTFSGQLFTRLAKELAGLPLIPGLQEIIVNDLDVTASSLLPLLLTPSLQSLRIIGKALSRQHAQKSLFPSLAADAPRLRSLTLTHDDISLQSFELCFPGHIVEPDFMSSFIPTLPLLRDLKLDIAFRHLNSTCPTPPAHGDEQIDPFSSLHRLHLVLRQSSGTCHVNSSIRFCSAWSPLLLNQIVQALSRSPCFSRLKLTQRKGYTSVNVPFAAALHLLSIATLEELIMDVNFIAFAN
ncbi:hypothetical protein BKA70DRAFT_1388294 [Coprinopsis sp. MPI-PUGE-AT-0042]|nr:hypothetical protein BKA70DRAFT_1388294 [Coprinopsis sp. MPI-PUGE-AT-0042]